MVKTISPGAIMELLLDFDDMKQGNIALKKLRQAFTRAGASVASADVDPKIKRTSGRSYRQVQMTFTDNQTMVFHVNQSGDIFQVRLNGALTPIKNQSDHKKAVSELVAALDKGRAKHQAKLARARVMLPKGIKTAAPKLEVQLRSASEELDTRIAAAETQLAELKASRGVVDSVEPEQEASTLDTVSPNGEWHSRTMEAMKRKSLAQLQYIIKDATAAAKAAKDLGNDKAEGRYIDEVHYASMEIQRRKKGGKVMDDSDSGAAHGDEVLDAATRIVVNVVEGKDYVTRNMDPRKFIEYVEKESGETRLFLPRAIEIYNEQMAKKGSKQKASQSVQKNVRGKWQDIGKSALDNVENEDSEVLDAAVRQVVEIKQGNSFVYRAMEPQDFLRRVEKLAKKRPKTLPEAVDKFNELNEDKQTAKVVAQHKKMGRWITIMGASASAPATEDNADYFSFQVEGERSMTIVVKVKPGSSEAEAKKSAVNAAEKAALGEGATGLKSGGKKLSKIPRTAMEIAGAKGWGWIVKGHPVLDAAPRVLAQAVIDGEIYDDLSVAEHIVRQEMSDDQELLQEVMDCLKVMREDTGAMLDSVPNLPESAKGVSLDTARSILDIHLDMLLNNEPINRADGNVGQADLELESAESIRLALSLIGNDLALDAVRPDSSKDREIREIYKTLKESWSEGDEAISAYGRDEFEKDVSASFLSHGVAQLKKMKPSLIFLGSLLMDLKEEYQRDVLGGVAITKASLPKLDLSKLLKPILDAAWGKGSFDYIKFSASRNSLKKAYDQSKMPSWAKSG